MLRNFTEEVACIVGLAPQPDGALTSDSISLKNANKAWIKAVLKQGNAAQCTISVMQSLNVTDAGKAVTNNLPIWYNEDLGASDLLTRGTAAKSYEFSAATPKIKVVWFEIDPANALDVANNYDCIYVTSGGSNPASYLSVEFFVEPRSKASVLDSFIVD